MAAPKIKLYRLSRDFTIDSLDKDKKTEVNDELLPVYDKYVSADDIMAKRSSAGILPSEDRFIEELTPISTLGSFSELGMNYLTANLVLQEVSASNSGSLPSNSSSDSNTLNSGIYSVSLSDYDKSILGDNFKINMCMDEGVYPIVITNENESVPSNGWEAIYDGEDLFIKATGEWCYHILSTIMFVNIASMSSAFSSKHAPIYTGRNTYFSPFVFMLKDGVEPRYRDNVVDGISVLDNHDSEMVFFKKAKGKTLTEEDDYCIIPSHGVIVLSDRITNIVGDKKLYISYVSLAYNQNTGVYKDTKRFVSEHINLIPQNEENTSGGHLFMGPDIFLGMKQYEPSSYESDTGEVITMGITPAYVEPGNYTISHRNGFISFPAKVNSNPSMNTADYAWNSDNLIYTKNGTYTKIGGSVHVSYAYSCCIDNVNGQLFEKYYSYDDIYGENSNSISISSSDIIELKSGDIVFRPSELDYRYSKSIGAPWVKRNNTYMPTRVYVTYKKYKDLSNSSSLSAEESEYEVVTEVKPQVITIPNYDELKIKTGK